MLWQCKVVSVKMEKKKNNFYEFRTSDEENSSDSESLGSCFSPDKSCSRDSPPLLFNPEHNSDSPPLVFYSREVNASPPLLLSSKDKKASETKSEVELQTGEGVVTRRQAKPGSQSPIQKRKDKTSAKLKAKNRTKRPDSPKPGPSKPPQDKATQQINKQKAPVNLPTDSPTDLTTDLPTDSDEENNVKDQNVSSKANLFEQETKVFENKDFVLLMQKTDHQRQKVNLLYICIFANFITVSRYL